MKLEVKSYTFIYYKVDDVATNRVVKYEHNHNKLLIFLR